jgi:hypothetical protein
VNTSNSASRSTPATHRRFLFGLGALVAALTCPLAHAAKGDTWLDVNLTSWHSERDYVWEREVRRYNARNFGLGATYELTDWFEAKAGFFENSYDKTSLYAVAALDYDLLPSSRWLLAPGVAGGLVTGYKNTPEQTGTVAPWGLVTLTIGRDSRWRLNLGYLPSRLFDVGTVDLVTVQIAIRL